MKGTTQELRPLVALIGFLLLIWMLRAAMSAIMPLTVAALIVVLVWPLQSRLERRLPGGVSAAISVFALSLVLAGLGVMFWLCGNAIADKAGEYQQLFQSFLDRVNAMLSHQHIPHGLRHWSPNRLVGQAMDLAGSFAVGAYQFFGYVVLIMVVVVLLLIEIHPFARRLRKRFAPEQADKVMDVARNTAASVRRFMLMRTFTSGITAVLTGLFTWAIGLDFALVWAVIALVLNYVPVFGSIVAVVPPTLVALIQPHGGWLALLTLGGLAVIQFTVGNYLDPLLQGRYLALPPLVVFYSLVFWGWVWGIPGALLGVPLTMGIVITCEHFERTRWVSRLLLDI